MKQERCFDGAPVRPVPARVVRGRVAHSAGCLAEGSVARAYVDLGHEVVAERWRGKGGEIDLILRAPDGTLVFVEVRARRGVDKGGAAASVGAIKQRRVVLAAQHYLMRLPAPPPCRFDVVAIDGGHIEWLRGAFDAG